MVQDIRAARLGDRIWHEPIVTGSVIEGSDDTYGSAPDVKLAHVTAEVVCAWHPIPHNQIETGARNSLVRGVHGTDQRAAVDGSVCTCGATVIATAENTFFDGNV